MVDIGQGIRCAALFQGGAPGACQGTASTDAGDMVRYLAASGACIAFAGYSSAGVRRGSGALSVLLESRGGGRLAVRLPAGRPVLTPDQRRGLARRRRSSYESAVAVGRATMLADKLAPQRNPAGPKFGHIPLTQFAQATGFLWDSE